MSDKHQHLQFIQDVISRMSNHSFVLKGWMITLVAGLVAVSSASKQPALVLVSWTTVLFIWCLDAFFLWREKQFRELYDQVRAKEEANIDFEMNPVSVKDKSPGYLKVLFAPTLAPFYVGAALIPVLVFVMR